MNIRLVGLAYGALIIFVVTLILSSPFFFTAPMLAAAALLVLQPIVLTAFVQFDTLRKKRTGQK